MMTKERITTSRGVQINFHSAMRLSGSSRPDYTLDTKVWATEKGNYYNAEISLCGVRGIIDKKYSSYETDSLDRLAEIVEEDHNKKIEEIRQAHAAKKSILNILS